jgi:hypothetical protein
MVQIVNRAAVVLRPKQAFVDWLHGCPDPPTFITLEDLLERGENSVYLIPDIEDLSETDKVIKKMAPAILEAELEGWYTNEDAWPKKLDYNTLHQLFEVKVPSMVIDILDRPIRREKL